jgi:hypothetical protein
VKVRSLLKFPDYIIFYGIPQQDTFFINKRTEGGIAYRIQCNIFQVKNLNGVILIYPPDYYAIPAVPKKYPLRNITAIPI